MIVVTQMLHSMIDSPRPTRAAEVSDVANRLPGPRRCPDAVRRDRVPGGNPIDAQVYDIRVMRQLSLSFGVYADYIPMNAGSIETLKQSICQLLEEKKLADNSLIIVLIGSFDSTHRASFIDIATAGTMKEKCVIS